MPSRAISKRQAALAVGVTLLLQFLFQAWFFPLDQLSTSTRLVHIDSVYHQHMMETTAAFCHDGRVTGYDPHFQAGFVSGTTGDVSTKWQTLAACVVGRADAVPQIYKIFSFGFGVVGPALLVLGAALFGLELGAVWIVALLAVVAWWTGPVRWFHAAGMTSYIAAAYLTVPFAAIAARACVGARAGWVIAAAACAALGTLLHPLFPVPAALIAAPLIASELRRDGTWWRAFGVVVVIAIATLAMNAFWLVPWLAERHLDVMSPPYQRLVDPLLIAHEAFGTAGTTSGGSRLFLALLLAATPAVVMTRGVLGTRLRVLALGFLLVMLLASFGGMTDSIAFLQPNRFSVAAWLALALPASVGLLMLARRATTPGPIAMRAVAGAILLPVVALVAFFVRDTGLEIFGGSGPRYAVSRPEVKEGGLATSDAIVMALKARTDHSARVFFETSLGRAIDGAHVAGYLALASDREFIGGPYPFNGLVNAWDDFAWGRPLSKTPTAELIRLLDLYNVRWMFCRTAACRDAMAAIPGAHALTDVGSMTLMERPMTPSFMLSGSGSIDRRCLNRVEVTSNGSADLVLKYHWVEGLVTVPAARLEPRFVEGIRRPFIAVIAPPPTFAFGRGAPSAEACPAP